MKEKGDEEKKRERARQKIKETRTPPLLPGIYQESEVEKK